VRRATLGLMTATGLAVLAGCSPVPEGAVAAESVACPEGSDCFDPVQPVGPGGELEIAMDEFFFEVRGGLAVTGDVAVTVVNEGGTFHDANFLGAADGSEKPQANPGESGSGTVKLFPGEYTVICDVPGHRTSGMETTITVYASEEEAAEAGGESGETGADTGA